MSDCRSLSLFVVRENLGEVRGSRTASASISCGKSSSLGAFVSDDLTLMKISVKIASASSPKFDRRIVESQRVRYATEESAGGDGGLASSTGEVEILPARDPARPVRICAPRSAAFRCWYAVSFLILARFDSSAATLARASAIFSLPT